MSDISFTDGNGKVLGTMQTIEMFEIIRCAEMWIEKSNNDYRRAENAIKLITCCVKKCNEVE